MLKDPRNSLIGVEKSFEERGVSLSSGYWTVDFFKLLISRIGCDRTSGVEKEKRRPKNER